MSDLNPQGKQMADESMIRTLDAQANAIWPQEERLLARYRLPADLRILDAGCGTGEGASRFAKHFPQARVLGIDIIDSHLALARTRFGHLAPRLAFERGDLFDISSPDHCFDLTVCRHVLHSIPHADRVIAELVRVTRPGGYLHLIAEDYGMLHFERGALDPRQFWNVMPDEFGATTGTDLFIGRHAFGLLAALGLEEVTVDYIIVDTLRVPRTTFASMLEAWRDGFATAIGESTSVTRAAAQAYFDEMISQVRDPLRYAVWMVPVLSGRVPMRFF